jgi:hypothetical protein
LFEIKSTLDDGNCFYSSIYRALKNKSLLRRLINCYDSLESSNEREFIKKLRELVAKSGKRSIRNMFQHFSIENFSKNTFKQVIKYIGGISTVLRQYYDENKFQPEYEEEFIEDIQKIIRKNKSWAGNLEVDQTEDILNPCGIYLYKFNTKNTGLNKINNDYINNPNYTMSLYLINDGEVHWEYIDRK